MSEETTASPKPKICVVIGRTRHKMMQAEIKEAGKKGAELIEIRLDYLKKSPDFKRLLADKPCEIMATVRRPTDGGRWGGSEEARQMLLRQTIVGGFDWVDLETDIIDKIPRFGHVKRLVSYHNMREIPSDLDHIHKRMCEQDADVVKIAVRAQKPKDVLRVIKLAENAPKPTVAIAMGDFGVPSRILGVKFGAPFTYAAFNKDRTIAPGLISFDEMRKVYGITHINKETKVFGVMGDPISHSLSPLIHNRAFREKNVNAVYVPFRVPKNVFQEHLNEYSKIPVDGYSVTIPLKEDAVTAAQEAESIVKSVQAANTLIRTEDGSFFAHNTDYTGALESLKLKLQEVANETREDILASCSVLILGAGGVARAIAYALKREGALLSITNRTHQRAIKLADELNCRSVDWHARHSVKCSVVINCTPIGMHPNVDESPLHSGFLKPDLVVFDTVYVPETTLLIKEALSRGGRIITGVDFFVRQAAAQFKLFSGEEAPLDLMYKVVKRALSPVRIPDDEA